MRAWRTSTPLNSRRPAPPAHLSRGRAVGSSPSPDVVLGAKWLVGPGPNAAGRAASCGRSAWGGVVDRAHRSGHKALRDMTGMCCIVVVAGSQRARRATARPAVTGRSRQYAAISAMSGIVCQSLVTHLPKWQLSQPGRHSGPQERESRAAKPPAGRRDRLPVTGGASASQGGDGSHHSPAGEPCGEIVAEVAESETAAAPRRFGGGLSSVSLPPFRRDCHWASRLLARPQRAHRGTASRAAARNQAALPAAATAPNARRNDNSHCNSDSNCHWRGGARHHGRPSAVTSPT